MRLLNRHIKNIFILIVLFLVSNSCDDKLDKDLPYYFVGDSIIARWPLDETIPSLLVYNYGKSGAGISYLEDISNQFLGKDVVVMVGTNNNTYFYTEEIDDYVDRYLRAVSSLTDKKIYLFSVLPREFINDSKDINEKITLFNSKIKESLTNYPQIVYIDVFDEFMNDGHINYQYYHDGLHPNNYGYEVLSSYFLKEIE